MLHRAAILIIAVLVGGCDPEPLGPIYAEGEGPTHYPTCDETEALPQVATPPWFAQAADLIWERYGNPGEQPSLHVVEGDYLYVDPNGWTLAGRGCGSEDNGRIYVPQRTGVPSDTTLAHELLHFALWHATGNPDANHVGPEWDGVEATNYWLRKQDL